MADNFAWYRDALAGHPGPVHENEPRCGYFRVRNGKNGPWVPVGIWQEGEQIFAHRGDDAIEDFSAICALWTYACRNPVAYDVYARACRGEPWPDDIPEPKPRSNADEFTQLNETLAELIAAIDRDLAEADLTDAAIRDKAANYATRIVEVGSAANAAREAEKRPFLEGGRDVDAKWNPLLDSARAHAKTLKARIGDALKIVAARMREAQGAAAEERMHAKAGTRGKAVSLRTRKRAIVTDMDAVCAYLLKLEPPPAEFVEGMNKVVRRMTDAGVSVPGVTIQIEEFAA